MKNIQVALNEEQIRAIDLIATKTALSRSSAIRMLLVKRLREEAPDEH